MYKDLSPDQQSIAKAMGSGMRPKKRGEKVKKAIADLWEFITGGKEMPPGMQTATKKDPSLGRAITNVIDAHRDDPQFGPEMTEDITDKLSTYSKSMLINTEEENFDTRDNGYGNESFPGQAPLDYKKPPELQEEDPGIDWSYQYDPETEQTQGNSESPEIKQAQTILMEMYGDDVVGEDKNDGFLGKDTDAAIKTFQREYNEYQRTQILPEDGLLDQKTLDAMIAVETTYRFGGND